MPYCKHCKKFRDKKTKTGFGTYPNFCIKYKIGRLPDSDGCQKIELIK